MSSARHGGGHRGEDDRTRFGRLLHQPQMTGAQRSLAHRKDPLAAFLSSWLPCRCSSPATITVSLIEHKQEHHPSTQPEPKQFYSKTKDDAPKLKVAIPR
ncbi:MAG TPA: hypothetical protein VII93_05010 [Anaerolineales bacterium]